MNLIIIKIIVGIVGILPIDTYNSSSIVASNALRKSLPQDLESKCSNAKAFEILESKCNVCHRKRNKRRIFSKENMDSHANDIYKQVFVKKRMPKGKRIKLSDIEYQELSTWISSIKNNQNGNKL